MPLDRIINQHTLIPLSGIAVAMGAVFWLTNVYASVLSNTAAVKELKSSVQSTDDSRAEYRQRLWQAIRSQDKRLAVIEGKLDVIADLVTEVVAQSENKSKNR